MKILCAAFVFAFCFLMDAANADVRDWFVGKITNYRQTADNSQPTVVDSFEFEAHVALDNNTDVTVANLLNAPGGTIAMNERFFGADWELLETFNDQATFNAAFPDSTTYMIETNGGLGPISEPVTLGAAPQIEVPFFTGSVFSALAGIDPSQPLSVSWTAAPQGVTSFVYIDDLATGFSVWENGTPLPSDTVPAGALQPGGRYQLGIVFAILQPDNRDSFPNGEGFSAHANITAIDFTVPVPEPLAGALAIALGGSLLSRRSRAGR